MGNQKNARISALRRKEIAEEKKAIREAQKLAEMEAELQREER